MSKFLAVFKFTYFNIVFTKSFISVSLIIILGSIGFSNFENISNFLNKESKAAVLSENKIFNIINENKKNINKKNSFLKVESKKEMNKLFDKNYISHAYYITKDNNNYKIKVYYKNKPDKNEVQNIQSVLNVYKNAKLSREYNLNITQIQNINKLPVIEMSTVEKEQINSKYSYKEQNLFNYIIYFTIISTFYIIISFSNQAALEVANEKNSKVIEMILTSITPTTHLWAKVFALISAAATQLLIFVSSAISSFYIFDINVLDAVWTNDAIYLIFISVIFSFLGIASYIILSMIIGSLNTSLENISQDVMPLNILLFIPMYLVIMNLDNANSALVKISSYIPFFSPFTMLLRVRTHNYSNIELFISLILSSLAIAILSIIAIRSYKSLLLTTDKSTNKLIKKIF
ncbi:ABC transporter permease [Staphylococcus agnetis]|uniref:ABC transporter permease n=1 Tax=Staphylococcus agnetis TaxID=985762 RepID=UPI00208F8684|nr:ABC transporter permease [Staphylococcus agnetis]MCO4327811.1 ABC transporter permease [Staphylococcus agnetis]MCO4353496.1 ABC transporter permease [Staphylococcus agnetis]MCO4370184.1 ABC transporter permease [Staphylococcus agnetis]